MLPKLPAPYLAIRDFLSAEEQSALLAWTTANEARFNVRHVQEGDVELVRKYRLDDLGPSAAVFARRIQSDYAEWIRRLRVSAFTLGDLELRVGAYPDGSYFDYHLDAPMNKNTPESSRRLTAVYYYYREPKQFSGGELRLYHLGAAPGSDDRIAIPPDGNSLVVFPSWVGHDVTQIHCSSTDFADARFAVNCWLHKAE